MRFVHAFPLLILAIFVLSVNTYGQTPLFTSTEGKFSIELSSKYLKESDMLANPDMKPEGKVLTWILNDESIGFIVMYADSIWAKKGEEKFRAGQSADGLIESFQARGDKLISRQNISLGNNPGVEVRYISKDEKVTHLYRYYVVESRIYGVSGIWISASKEARVLKVLNSFKVVTTGEKIDIQ